MGLLKTIGIIILIIALGIYSFYDWIKRIPRKLDSSWMKAQEDEE